MSYIDFNDTKNWVESD